MTPYIVVQHADNSYVSPAAPAQPGEVIVLWGTGFGPPDPVTATIGGQSAAIQFAGVVGPGLMQINVQIPAGIGNGDAPVVLSVGGVNTQTTNNLIPIHP